MRKGVLGTIAALATGASAAFGQMPGAVVPPPTPVAPATNYSGGGLAPVGHYSDPIPPQLGGGMPGGGGYGGPPDGGMFPGGPSYGGGAPTYPPPGVYGQQSWQAPAANPNAASKIWLRSEYLLWFVKAQPANTAFVTTSAPNDRGVLGQPTTSTLFNNTDLGYGVFSGFRISGGYFKGEDRRYGVEMSGFLTEQNTNSYFAASDRNGVPVIARPFIDATTGTPAVLSVAQPGFSSGSILVESSTRLYGAEGSMVANIYRSCPDDCYQINTNAMLGFRYMDLQEDLNINSASTLLGNGTAAALFNGATVFPPATIGVRDSFETTNRFYGGQVGLSSDLRYNRMFFSVTGKLAFGIMNQVVDVTGRSDINDPTQGLAAASQGGVFANAQNIQRYRNDEFAIIPELNLSVGYNVTSWLSGFVGYNFLYTNRVVRPGNSLNPVVNPAVLPTSFNFGNGGVVPVANRTLTQDDYFAQGVSFGLLARY